MVSYAKENSRFQYVLTYYKICYTFAEYNLCHLNLHQLWCDLIAEKRKSDVTDG